MPDCDRLVNASGLLDPTPPAALPESDVASSGFTWGLAQTGQLDKSNNDKAGARRLNDECHRLHREAAAKAKRPWWQFWK
ncbi:hypothetical protein [uncultured Sphingorhabdus sp.]|uniref:hypothetical protein n=1 Tax=uncultured Sphingorhabdus sp. TaxID=1686106 RepID=UPI002604457F|nr:hypothetical protein [uncultured Sphingorhabdus sp.]